MSTGAVYTQDSNTRSVATPQGAKSQAARSKEKIQYDIQELKRQAGMTPFAERLDLDSNGFCGCPFHDSDSDKSFHVVPKEGVAIGTCFSECGRSWDCVDFVKKFDNVGTHEALKRIAASNTAVSHRRATLPKKEPALAMTPEMWASRGRPVTAQDVAKLATSRPHSATPSAETLNRLGFKVTSTDYLVCPYRHGNTFYTIKGRKLTEKSFLQENAVSQQGLFNVDSVSDGCDVFLVESELDAAVLEENGYTAVSVINAKQKSIESEVLRKLCQAQRIFLAGDQDSAGQICMNTIAKLLPPEKIYWISFSSAKDVGEWALAVKQDEPLLGSFRENWEQLRKDTLASWVAHNIPFAAAIPNNPQKWTVDRLLPYGGLLMVSGKYGAMKSILALWMGTGIESSPQVFGRAVLQRTPVLYVDRENPPSTIGERRSQMGIAENAVRYWGDWFDEPTPSLADPRLEEFMRREKGVIVFDSLVDWLDGANENDPSKMTEIMHKFRRLARLGSGVILLHHADKYRAGFRGTTAIPAGCDMALKITKTDDGVLQLREEKFRMCGSWEMDIRFSFHEQIACEVLRDESPDTRRKTQAADNLATVCKVLAEHHESSSGAGMPKTRLVAALREYGISKDKATGVLTAAGKSGTLRFESGDRGAILYYLDGWKAESQAFA